MQGMHRWIVEFALVITVLAVIYEMLVQLSGKRLWVILAKWHIGIAAAMMFVSVLSGLIDMKFAWMTAEGKQLMASHETLGFVLFFLILLLANYRLILHKLLPEKLFCGYLGLCGLCLGLIFGIGQIGKLGIYQYGVGVDAAMITHDENMEYIKALYNLNELPPPTAEDSQRASPLKPTAPDTLSVSKQERRGQPIESEQHGGHHGKNQSTMEHH